MSAELGPLPEPEAFFYVDDSGRWVEARSGSDACSGMYTTDQMRVYTAAEVAKERERCIYLALEELGEGGENMCYRIVKRIQNG
jgi:hypothetical protein